MTPFKCLPIPTETAARFRRTGRDDRGHALRRLVSDGCGVPCRHCLRGARSGEAILLGSYDLPGPLGIYWTPSPIFVHADPCPLYAGKNEIPEIARLTRVGAVL